MKKCEIQINFHSGEVDFNTILQRIIRIKVEKHFDTSMGENMNKLKHKQVKKS